MSMSLITNVIVCFFRSILNCLLLILCELPTANEITSKVSVCRPSPPVLVEANFKISESFIFQCTYNFKLQISKVI